jgi:hypothetical protein
MVSKAKKYMLNEHGVKERYKDLKEDLEDAESEYKNDAESLEKAKKFLIHSEQKFLKYKIELLEFMIANKIYE